MLTIAIPKGRIFDELSPIFDRVGLTAEADFYRESTRKLIFTTNHPLIRLIRVRSFDVATFVAYGSADIGFVGRDVFAEFQYDELLAPLDMRIGRCRLAVARPKDEAIPRRKLNVENLKIATKYTRLTQDFYMKRGLNPTIIKLNGSMELAPKLGLADKIVDLVDSGRTLAENNLVEEETILEVSTLLVANRLSYKIYPKEIGSLVEEFGKII